MADQKPEFSQLKDVKQEESCLTGPRLRGVLLCAVSNGCGHRRRFSLLAQLPRRGSSAMAYVPKERRVLSCDKRHHIPLARTESCHHSVQANVTSHPEVIECNSCKWKLPGCEFEPGTVERCAQRRQVTDRMYGLTMSCRCVNVGMIQALDSRTGKW